MIRVHVICEGQTEEMFVNEMLIPIFQPKDILLVPALLGEPGHKGGNVSLENDLDQLAALTKCPIVLNVIAGNT